MGGLRFFFSYTREDGDAYLNRFYDDLVAEVRSEDEEVGQEIGFRDTRDIKLGEDWLAGIASALQHAKVMVCVFSKKYFHREWCGKEWGAFANRIAEHRNLGGNGPLIIPVLWTLPREIPEIARVGQWTNDDLGTTYAEKGLRHLAKLKSDDPQDEYTRAVEIIAKAVICGVRRGLPSAPAPPDYSRARNAFAPPAPVVGQAAGVNGNAGATPPSGPRFVEFVVAAGRADEIAAVRGAAPNYGTSWHDWIPYAPSSRRRVGPLLQGVASAADLDLDSHTTALDNNLDQLVTTAEDNNTVVILTVDPWSLLLERFQAPLRAYDRRLSVNSATVVPWNDDDPLTLEQTAQLDLAIQRTLTRHTLMNAPTLHTRVSSESDLVDRVQQAIRRAQGLIIQYGKVRSPAESDTPIHKPEITAQKDSPAPASAGDAKQ